MADNHSRPTLRHTTPVFLVADIASTMGWYSNVLGFDARPFPESAPHSFCILTRDDITIFLQQLAGYSKPDLYAKRDGGVWSVYVQTQDVRQLFRELSQRDDVTMLERLCHQEYGQTEFVIRDPNGYAIVFAEPD
jgi:uncharacterized glyoxalase superfamily protein PhnB